MTAFRAQKPFRWLFLDLNAYFASVEQQETPALRNRPIAIIPSNTDATCAIAASYEAKAYGIKTGTKIYEAKKICPDLICVLARHHLYIEYHHKILDEVKRHIPITKICSVDEVACELLGHEQCEEYVTELSQRIKDGIHKNIGQSINCSIGIAQNSFLAKIASDMQKPNGFTILTPENLEDRLFTLKLRDLTGIGHNMERRLNSAGITTVKQLWNIQPKHARKVWGSVAGERFWYKLRGYEIPDIKTTKRMVGHSRMLDPAMRNSDKAYPIARNLTIKAATRLRRYKLYGRSYAMKVRTVSGRRWADARSFSPTQDNFVFTNLLEDMWQRMTLDIGSAKLLKLSVMIYDLHEKQNITLDLFETQSDQVKIKEGLSIAMDSLNKRYGSNTVSLGLCPKTDAGYLGTKIAFNRIPELEEFSE
ncbi:MAG: impB/mucB/samB family protein [Alphaproteobacteria bacterium]|nr:MAG: impB/mucB/samB family protein [Alphaproteobacteria bacterium]